MSEADWTESVSLVGYQTGGRGHLAIGSRRTMCGRTLKLPAGAPVGLTLAFALGQKLKAGLCGSCSTLSLLRLDRDEKLRAEFRSALEALEL